jgi:hypothetical protein
MRRKSLAGAAILMVGMVVFCAQGLQKFQRTLKYSSGKLTVTDAIESATPHVYTEAMYSDTTIAQQSANAFMFGARAQLRIVLVTPKDAAAKVEGKVVMGPGKPGSVDKGTLEARGERLVVSTKSLATTAAFVWEMTS